MVRSTAKLKILKDFLEREIPEWHNAETFSRDGESTDYVYGEWAGKEELAKAIVDFIDIQGDKKTLIELLEKGT